MKISSILAPVLRHKIISAAVLLCIAGSAGGLYGYQAWQHRKTPEYAISQFTAALNPLNLTELAARVDFNSLAGSVARALMEYEPNTYGTSEKDFTLLREKLQQELLAALTEDPEKAKARDADKDAPIFPLPADFALQIAQNTRFLSHSGLQILQTALHHPAEATPVQMLFVLRQDSSGKWIVGEIANAKELVFRFAAARQRQKEAKEAAFHKKNEDIKQQMKELLRIQHCEASAAAISDGKTVLVVINILARNAGKQAVHNANATAELFDSSDRLLLARKLNSSSGTAPGEDFRQQWTIELDADTAEAKSILQAHPIICRAAWNSMLPEDGKLLYIREKPKEEAKNENTAKPQSDVRDANKK